ncbi:MAG TPA: radical SAM protein [Syntrophaceae bacterium]|nr:radical SAM protein [Syntrophaceae bacterium]
MDLKINEIFYSIQGESTYVGVPCIFIRLSGCNLRCTFCDTTYAYDEGKMMSVDEVMDKVESYHTRLVEITGGEPLLQDGVYILIHELIERDYTVLLETNGSITLSKVNGKVIKIMDLKCPSSGMSHKMDFSNIHYINKKDQVKFVIGDRGDYNWAKEIINRYNLLEITQVLMSPVHQTLEPNILARWILDDRLPVRFQIQLHKYIWEPNKPGI